MTEQGKYLLDTHAAIWAAEDDSRLGENARTHLLSAKHGNVYISDITLLEIAMLVKKERLQINTDTTSYLMRLTELYPAIPITPRIATNSMDLKLPQGDPFDRVIVATAQHQALILITKDTHITNSNLLPVVW